MNKDMRGNWHRKGATPEAQAFTGALQLFFGPDLPSMCPEFEPAPDYEAAESLLWNHPGGRSLAMDMHMPTSTLAQIERAADFFGAGSVCWSDLSRL